MGDAVFFQVLNQCFLQYRVVMAVVQCAGTRQKVDVALTFGGNQLGALGLVEKDRE